MSVHASIREYLTKHMGQAFTARQIADAIDCELQPVAWGLNTMRSRGVVICEVTGPRGHRYRMDTEWTRKPKLEGETHEKQRIYRKRWLDKRKEAGLPRYRSPTDVRRMEEARVRTEARNAVLAERKANLEAEKVKSKERLTLERKSKLVAVVAKNAESRKTKAGKVSPVPARAESVEEWMARTGKQPERLSRGATSGKLAA